MEQKEPKLIDYVCDRIKKWKIFSRILKHLLMPSENTFDAVHVKTIVNKKIITFCLIKLCEFIDDIFILCSDHPDGVYKILCLSDAYRINWYTRCVFGMNRLPRGKIARCNIFTINKDIHYLEVDWLTGLIESCDNNIIMCNDIMANQGISGLLMKQILRDINSDDIKSTDFNEELLTILSDLPDEVMLPIFECLVFNNYSEKGYKDAVLLFPKEIINRISTVVGRKLPSINKADILIEIEKVLRTFVIELKKMNKSTKKRNAKKKAKLKKLEQND
jgi:hypothetical protein